MRESRTRKGVLLTQICGQYLLVADRNARKICPYVRHVNETGALIWKMLESGAEDEAIIISLKESYDLPEEEAASAVGFFLEQLTSSGYLKTEDNHEEK